MMICPCQRLLTVLLVLLLASCKNWRPGIFVQRSPREQYASDLQIAGAGWIGDGDSALRKPAEVKLPYREAGVFPRGIHAAAALEFAALEGERIIVRLDAGSPQRPPVFLELYRQGAKPERLLTPETGSGFLHNVDWSGTYMLLLQGRLDSPTTYTLTIAAGPSLAYPATNPLKNRIGSVWGDARDAGARRHEGVDIFAPKGSPALAACPGRIIRLTDGGIGGKTVWLRPEGRALSLYYAHLDSQWVHEGDYVRAGDTLGQIGNTGNARHTAAHLHFGIYTAGGAINPAPFIRPQESAPRAPQVPIALLGTARKLRVPVTLQSGPGRGTAAHRKLPAGSEVWLLAGTSDQVRVRIADSLTCWITYNKSLFVSGSR